MRARRKNIGKCFLRARLYYRRHRHFERTAMFSRYRRRKVFLLLRLITHLPRIYIARHLEDTWKLSFPNKEVASYGIIIKSSGVTCRLIFQFPKGQYINDGISPTQIE